jgi:tetratricopeptide (TPR) repeat protein
MCGACRFASGSCQAALDFFDQAVKANNNEPLAYIGRGAARKQMRDITGAIADYSEAIRLDPLDDDTYLARAHAYKASGDEKRANSDMAEALRIKAQQSEGDNKMGSGLRPAFSTLGISPGR